MNCADLTYCQATSKATLIGTFVVSTFTGKERDEETGYGYFGARYYDDDLLTGWTSVDPLSDKYSSISSYAYCKRNPIGLIDIDGREIYYIEGMTKYVYKKSQDGVYGFYNSKTGDSYSGDASQYVNDLTAALGKLQEGDFGAKLVGFFEGNDHDVEVAFSKGNL